MNIQNDTPNHIEIPLTKGYSTIVSLTDADLAKLKWFALTAREKKATHTFKLPYAAHKRSHLPGERQVTEFLHRVILERVLGRVLAREEYVDHINGTTLDNRRENLRIASRIQNAYNRGRGKNNTSGYKGVSYASQKKSKPWRASISVNGKLLYLGYFRTAEEAYTIYCDAAIKYHGEFHNLK